MSKTNMQEGGAEQHRGCN